MDKKIPQGVDSLGVVKIDRGYSVNCFLYAGVGKGIRKLLDLSGV